MNKKTISTKRSRALAIVIMTAILAGSMLVLALFLIRSVIFNAQLIAERDKALSNFAEAQENIETLQKKVTELENNESLEFLAAEKGVECYNDKGELINDYTKMEQKQSCTALRTLRDALPLRRNEEKTLAEVNRLVLSAGENVKLEKLAVNKDKKVDAKIDNIRTIVIEVAFSGPAGELTQALANLEQSIRQFDFDNMILTAQADGNLRIEGNMVAYYTTEATTEIQEKVMKTGLNGVIWNSINAKEEK